MLVLLGSLAAATCFTASANEVTYTASIAGTDTLAGWSNTLSIPQFNPAIGTLTSVDITFKGGITGSISGSNNSMDSHRYSFNFANTITLQRPDTSTLFTLTPSVETGTQIVASLAAFDWSGLWGTDTDSLTAPPPDADRDLFIGTGNIDFPVISSADETVATGNAAFDKVDTMSSRANISVKYTYDPWVITLAFTGDPGYVSDGVEPNKGLPGTNFTFKVEYSNNGDNAPLPQGVKVVIIGPTGVLAGSPFKMAPDQSIAYVAGVNFSKDIVLTVPGAYAYYFTANDGLHIGRLPASGLINGPIVSTPPALAWTGEPGYVTDGLNPNRAVAGSTFTFRIKYSDADGHAPTSVGVRLFNAQNGTLIAGSPFAMTEVGSGTDWVAGEIFTGDVVLPAGMYQYRFVATDKFDSVLYPAVGRSVGPRVDATAGAVAVSGVSAQQVAGGVSVVYSLSAASSVQAVVYNLAGRVIATIAPADQAAGVQSLRWNGRNAAGSAVPAGVYLVQITAAAEDGNQASGLTTLQLQR